MVQGSRFKVQGYVDDIRSLVEEIGEEAQKFYDDMQPERARELMLRAECLMYCLDKYIKKFRPKSCGTLPPSKVKYKGLTVARLAD